MTAAIDRARRHTSQSVLRRIDDDAASRLVETAEHPRSAAERLEKLEREWDLDRVIETEASIVGLVGLALGTSVRREFLALPLLAAGGVLLYALSGRYPLLPLFRRVGVRTAGEIAKERYAVKALRGDFAHDAEATRAPERGA